MSCNSSLGSKVFLLLLSCSAYIVRSGSDSDFVKALVLGDHNYYASYDLGQSTFNEMFQTPNKDAYLIKRECAQCAPSHQLIYYKRYTNLDTVNAYFFMEHWMSNNNGIGNILGVDFDLFSTFDDAMAGTNKWSFCNYDDYPVGAFRDCGPNGGVAGEWTMRNGGPKNAMFSIYMPPSGSDSDFVEALVLGDYTSYPAYDLGQSTFNAMFRTPNKDAYLIKRECAQCAPTHQLIYYKRYTNLNNVDTYFFMEHWMSNHNGIGNILGVDFDLFSTFDDAMAGTNKWTYCNYDDYPVGAFRDCGPNGKIDDAWTKRYGGPNNARFSIYMPPFASAGIDNGESIKLIKQPVNNNNNNEPISYYTPISETDPKTLAFIALVFMVFVANIMFMCYNCYKHYALKERKVKYSFVKNIDSDVTTDVNV